MDFFSLRCFVEVARAGNFTKAAERIGRTQPAVSQQIAALEDALGAQLFDRSRKTVALSDAGRRLFDEAIGLLERFEDLPRIVGETENRPLQGSLAIASSLSLINHFLPLVVGAFHAAHPAVRVSIANRTSAGIMREVAEGRADLGLGNMLGEHPDLEKLPLRDEPLYLIAPVLPEGDDWGPMIHFEAGIALREHIARSLPERHPFKVVLELPSSESILHYVRQGLGATILPGHALFGAGRDLASRPLDGILPPLKLEAVRHRRRVASRASLTFLELLEDQATLVSDKSGPAGCGEV
jgi:DNA-binding transcriptional LysR family regulator